MDSERIGSTLDSWLKEEGIYEEVTARATQRVLVRQAASAMTDEGLLEDDLSPQIGDRLAADLGALPPVPAP
jgi:hypothetical protein